MNEQEHIGSVAMRDSLKNSLEMTGCESEENLIDMANVGNSLMERIDSLVSMPGPYHHWSPADDPAEIVFDLVNDLDELREENVKLRKALEPFAKYAGDPSHIKQRAFLQLLICPLGDEHPDNHVPYFQAARAALAASEGSDA